MLSNTRHSGLVLKGKPTTALILVMPLLLCVFAPVVGADMNQEQGGLSPNDIWSDDYTDYRFPWGGDDAVQFKEYHDYESMKERMMRLAEQNPEFLEFHEGLNGGINARGETTTEETYNGWYYGHASPWLKITGNVQGGEYNPFNGDNGNYADRPDILIVGNHHAREWMSYEVPMFFLETLVFSYNNLNYDNDGDGLIDEDPWGDANGDGLLDDDGDCLALAPEFQDTDGDGVNCGPGDLGVDEDYSEEYIRTLVEEREIYLVPMLNVDGNRYDREVYCGETAWENCPTSGWRKNLRDNEYSGVTPLPDLDEEVDEACDGVDLNRNYEYEWGAPLGATGPLVPGDCIAGTTNNDVYNGPPDPPYNDEDGDGMFNEDDVDGNDDDRDGIVDEDPLGGNTEPETKFIQDLTEMNDDNENGGSEFRATLTWHSFSELVLYPWGHCTNCESPDHDQLVYHGDVMAEYTAYENMQSSDLYPTSGDFCDWHYGIFNSYCYTMEIGNAFHEHPDDIDDIAIRNVGVGFYMTWIADNPREKADLAMSNLSSQYLMSSDDIMIPESGDIPIDICIDENFPYSLDIDLSFVEWRLVTPTRQQSDYGPREWRTAEWSKANFSVEDDASCMLNGGENGTVLRTHIPVPDDITGQVHYRASLGTLSGGDLYLYPSDGLYNILDISYRKPYGSTFGMLFWFTIVAGSIWGGLGYSLRLMMNSGKDDIDLVDAVLEEANA